jgi:AraC family transcriptional regulator of arabinose operon
MAFFEINSAKLISAGRVEPITGWQTSEHIHEYWEFIYFISGGGRVDIPGAVFHPSRYHLMIYPPGTPHAEYADPVDPEKTIFISVEMKGEIPRNNRLILIDRKGEMKWLIEHIHSAYSQNYELANAYLKPFLLLIDRDLGCSIETGNIIEVITENIRNHPSRDWTLSELSELAGMSSAYFSRLFHSKTGYRPIIFIQKIRVETACQLLKTTNMRINEVAEFVGYNDQLYFSRVFKKITGVSPKLYKKTK